MPKTMTIEASTKINGVKVSATPRNVDFATRSEAEEMLKKGLVPPPWKSFREYHLDAVAHKVVEYQQEMREELTGTSSTTSRHTLDD